MKKLIVADDDEGLQEALTLAFQRAGFEVRVYSSGHALLNNDFDVPDVFMLDRQLLGIDGLEVCRFLKNQPATRDIPVIIASGVPNLAELAADAGANDFIEKPFRMKELLAKVRHCLE